MTYSCFVLSVAIQFLLPRFLRRSARTSYINRDTGPYRGSWSAFLCLLPHPAVSIHTSGNTLDAFYLLCHILPPPSCLGANLNTPFRQSRSGCRGAGLQSVRSYSSTMSVSQCATGLERSRALRYAISNVRQVFPK